MKRHPLLLARLLAVSLGLLHASTGAQSPTFPIERFDVQGNSLLAPESIAALVTPYQGAGKSFADIQLAQEALERAYRSLGFSAVAVTLPEQDISAGVVRFVVVEAKLDAITIKGHAQFTTDNILRSLPALETGTMPNAIAMADNLSLANENPAKRTEITLRISDKPGLVNADVNVEETPVQRFILGLDSTGQGSSVGPWRIGLAWQHANLFGLDHVLTLQYTTSPTQPSGVRQLNASYRIPLYAWGDSVDWYAGTSNVDASFGPASGIDSFVGKGKIVGVGYTHHLMRRGEIDHALALNWDWKQFDNSCSGLTCALLGGGVVSTPFSLTYRGDWTRAGAQTTWALTHARNTGWGGRNSDAEYAIATHQPGTVGTERNFAVWRLQAAHLQLLPHGWQSRTAVTAQMTRDPLIAGEQLGLAGNAAVRGFHEREVARDRGVVLNLEAYTPNLATGAGLPVDDLRAVVFLDAATGRYVRGPGESEVLRARIASLGVGLRLVDQKRLNVKFDLARVINDNGVRQSGDWMGHLAMTVAF